MQHKNRERKFKLHPYTQEIINQYKDGISTIKLAEKYNVHVSSICKLLERNGVERKHVSSSCYYIDENFFEKIDSEQKAYILGFIFADGCIVECKYTNVLRIVLAEKDYLHLEKIRDIVAPTYNINTSDSCKKHFNCQTAFIFSVGNNKICSDLMTHGCTPRKSLTLTFPTTVPDNLIHHFIRGYFDGDGCVCTWNKKTYFSLLGTYEFLKSIQNIFERFLNVNKNSILVYPRSKAHTIYYGAKKDIRSIREYFYHDATIYLQRKYDSFFKNEKI